MAKVYVPIGFAESVETAPGVYRPKITERKYYGDMIRNTRRLQTTDQVNDGITISNELSIVADPFAKNNFHAIQYVTYMGTKWKVVTVEEQYPRLRLTLGGIYNGVSA